MNEQAVKYKKRLTDAINQIVFNGFSVRLITTEDGGVYWRDDDGVDRLIAAITYVADEDGRFVEFNINCNLWLKGVLDPHQSELRKLVIATGAILNISACSYSVIAMWARHP